MSDTFCLVETLGTGGRRGLGDARGVLAVEVDGVDPEKSRSHFHYFRESIPFLCFRLFFS